MARRSLAYARTSPLTHPYVTASAKVTVTQEAMKVVEEAFLQLHHVDVEHHDDEQEEHGHGADIDDDQDHRDEFRADQHEQRGRVEEGQDQEQHRIDRVARDHDHGIRGDSHRNRGAAA